jgi:hypothetical protein
MQQVSDLDRLPADDRPALSMRTVVMWALLTVGFGLVAFPAQFAWLALAKPDNFDHKLAANLSEVEVLAQSFRFAGFLLFGAGLVERVLVKCGK